MGWAAASVYKMTSYSWLFDEKSLILLLFGADCAMLPNMSEQQLSSTIRDCCATTCMCMCMQAISACLAAGGSLSVA
jgi:hypothetical protein